MAEIGNLGDITFEITENKKGIKVLSFSDLQRTSEAEYEEHTRNGKKSFLEFLQPRLDTITLTIFADARYRVKPLAIKNKLMKYKDAGTVIPFVLGGRKVGKGAYVIISVQETPTEYFRDGRPIKVLFTIELRECPQEKKVSKKKKSETKTTATSKKGTASKITVKTASKTTYTTYTVKSGDTLASIAKKFYKKGSDYMKIYNANKDIIKNPNTLYVGQKIKIPK